MIKTFYQSKQQVCFNSSTVIKTVKPRNKKPEISVTVLCSVSIHLAETLFLFSKLPRSLKLTKFPWKMPFVFAQNVPCKFSMASGFENNSCILVNGFMSSLLHEMSRRVCPTSHQLKINSFSSFVNPV